MLDQKIWRVQDRKGCQDLLALSSVFSTLLAINVHLYIPVAGDLFWYVTNQPPKANSDFHSSGVGK